MSEALNIPEAITEIEAARYIGMSRSWLAQARMRGNGPPYIKIGRSVRYLRSDLDAWLALMRCHVSQSDS